jgi:hypothetical protein
MEATHIDVRLVVPKRLASWWTYRDCVVWNGMSEKIGSGVFILIANITRDFIYNALANARKVDLFGLCRIKID